jgi:hypothetical protein
MTGKNFDLEEILSAPLCGKQWFCLTNSYYDEPYSILHAIEPMFLGILARL